MVYANAQRMMIRFSAGEMAQVATPYGSQVVDCNLMRLTASGGNRDAWSQDEIDVADAALERITLALEEASVQMDAYLAMRYPLPLEEQRFGTTHLPGICCDIAHYLLQSHSETEVVATRHKAAIALLKDLATGKAGLGESSETPQGEMGMACMVSEPGIFGRGTR